MIVIGEVQGASCGQKTTVGEVLSLWPGLEDLDDKSFLMKFDHGGPRSKNATLLFVEGESILRP